LWGKTGKYKKVERIPLQPAIFQVLGIMMIALRGFFREQLSSNEETF